MIVIDRSQRQQAQDLSYSCVVRAPAGSGKTELLVQRALRALLVAEKPEHVLILTFTNKAVQELRERLIRWIGSSSEQLQGIPETVDLARAVQQRSLQKGWSLQECPYRLNIFTLDAYFFYLYQHFNKEKSDTPAELLSDPRRFYEEVVDDALEQLFRCCPDTTALLEIFDGSVSQLRGLFIQLTLSRDRWLTALYHDDFCCQPQTYLAQEIRILQAITESMAVTRDSIVGFLSQYDPRWTEAGSSEQAGYWRLWAEILLTEKGSWRQSFRAQQGIPQRDSLHSWHHTADRNQVLEDLTSFSTLLQDAALAPELLQLFRRLPRQTIKKIPQSFITTLKHWVALITIIKNERRVIDFIDLTFNIMHFFNTPDIAAGLEAFIDEHMTHLLIDEIQDLSRLQFQIISSVIRCFAHRPDKSVFMVGDPQQAIYHFRGAHIGVFADFEHLEIDGVPKINCVLHSNFRSAPVLVSFVSHWASQRFGQYSSAWLGVDKAIQSQAIQESQGSIIALSSRTIAAENAALFQRICAYQELNPTHSIAVLGRDRATLKPLMALFDYYYKPYDASDMLSLSQYAFAVDLQALIAIILQPEKRASWLPFLRSTWIRASFDDISYFFDCSPDNFWEIADLNNFSDFFQYDYKQWHLLIALLKPYQARSYCARFWDCLWLNMRLEEDLNQQEKLIWQITADFLRRSSWSTSCDELLQNLQDALDKPVSFGHAAQHNVVRFLTIHKAKGLEFDAVFLPHLGARLPTHERPFFLEVPIDDAIFWALNAPQEQEWFDFFDGVLKQQQDHEAERLLYVALTRAKTQLTLSWNTEKEHSRSFLTMLKKNLPDPIEIEMPHRDIHKSRHYLKRVPSKWPQWQWRNFQWNTAPLLWQDMTAAQDHDRIIGLVIHHCFASFHVRPWPKEQLTQKNLQILWGRFGGSILDWPVVFPRIGNALALIQKSTALEPVYAIEAQKIFAEFPVIMPDNHVAHQCRQIVIDKLILDTQGRYWIIEWKTGHAWQKSWEHYRQQLQQYAQAVMRALECHQPKIALYIMAADRLYIFDSCDDIPLYID